MHSRRNFLKKSAALTVGGAVVSFAGANTLNIFEDNTVSDNLYTLPSLGYDFNALEPHIDALTMEIHYGKHHNGYVTNLNKAINEYRASRETKEKRDWSLEAVCKTISEFPVAVRNNAGGHYNHSMFWKTMKPGGGGEVTGKIGEAINAVFGSTQSFREKFSSVALTHFGSGWAWLVVNNGKLEIGSTPNQDNPLMDVSSMKGKPLLGIDVWEHAYYMKYQSKRADYISAWWNVLNWEEVNRLFDTTG